MQLGTDQRKLQRVLRSPEPTTEDFGIWIRDETSVLQGWEKRSTGSEELSTASAHEELLLRRGNETALLQVPVHEFMDTMKHAVASSAQSLEQSGAFRAGMVKKFGTLAPLNAEHFLVRYCSRGFQAKFLPSQFGVFFRFLDAPEHSVMMIFRKGKLDGYAPPDLTGFHGRFLNGAGPARSATPTVPGTAATNTASKAPPAKDAIGRRARRRGRRQIPRPIPEGTLRRSRPTHRVHDVRLGFGQPVARAAARSSRVSARKRSRSRRFGGLSFLGGP